MGLPIKIELPEHFLEEEVRCGYTVSEQMKKVWAVELDLFKELQRVCDKYDIKYFAAGGTLLGAVRHKGFIPWDDDLDIVMLREEYDKLCGVAETEFKHPYFFQTQYTDKGTLRGHAQLRNSLTTALLKGEESHGEYNKGIFIDIFPLDNVVDDERALCKQGKKARRYKHIFSSISSCTTRYNKTDKLVGGRILPMMVRMICLVYDLETYFYKKYEKTCKMYNYRSDLTTVSELTFLFNSKNLYKNKEDYMGFVNMKFEFIELRLPLNYEEALRVRYGNYMEFVMDGNCHGEIFMDAENPYTKYVVQMK